MRLLAVHADRLAFEAVRPASDRDAEAPDGAPGAGECGECVAAFVAVERADRAALEAVAADGATAVADVADRLGADRIALLPRERLVDDPADATAAEAVLRDLADRLGADRDVLRAPVGWRLAVDCERKGHPFAEQARRVEPRRRSDGEDRSAEAATADALEELGLAAPDPATGGDALRWYPRGQFLRDAIREYAERLLADSGATPVATPAVDVHAAAERRGASAAGAAPIVGPADSDQLLRPGVHGGLLSALADAGPDDTPRRVSETVRRTADPAANADPGPFRRRVRPEVHAALPDESAAIEEFERLAAVARDAAAALGADADPVLELDGAFRDDHPGFEDRIAAALDEPMAVSSRAGDPRYWAARLSFETGGADDRQFPLGSVELDAETPERFGLSDADGEPPALVHAAPVGDIEGAIAALAAAVARGERPGLPTRLAPTQVRLVPIDDRHAEYCDDVAAELRAAGVRADVDARAETVGARLARSDRERVPYVAAVGDRELDGDELPVALRETGAEERLSIETLRERVLAESDGVETPDGTLPARVGEYPSLGGD